MDKDDPSRAVQQCGFPYFSWVHDGRGQASNAYRVIPDGSVLGIKGNQKEMFSVECRKLLPKRVKELAGVLELRIFREGIL
jgi:hypothetical protein